MHRCQQRLEVIFLFLLHGQAYVLEKVLNIALLNRVVPFATGKQSTSWQGALDLRRDRSEEHRHGDQRTSQAEWWMLSRTSEGMG